MKKAKLLVVQEEEDEADQDHPPRSPQRDSRIFEHINCATRLAKIVRESLNPEWRGSEVWIDLPHGPITRKALRRLIPATATAERKLGKVVREALVTGDKAFLDEIRKALQEIDILFNRKNLVDLKRRVMPFSHEVEATANKRAGRALIELRLRRALYDQEWARLQKHFGWDKTLAAERGRRKGSTNRNHKRG